jgi:hypothetical protein
MPMAPNENDQIMADPEDSGERNIKEPQEMRIETIKVVVDHDHPFDLEGYISQYSGQSYYRL